MCPHAPTQRSFVLGPWGRTAEAHNCVGSQRPGCHGQLHRVTQYANRKGSQRLGCHGILRVSVCAPRALIKVKLSHHCPSNSMADAAPPHDHGPAVLHCDFFQATSMTVPWHAKGWAAAGLMASFNFKVSPQPTINGWPDWLCALLLLEPSFLHTPFFSMCRVHGMQP